MIYEIVNPSDPYTIEAKSFDVAVAACLLLGDGQYAFDPLEEGGEKVPLFLFGGAGHWVQERFSQSLEIFIDRIVIDPAKSAELAECFESCLIGRLQDRKSYRAGLELIDDPLKRQQWRDRWQEDRLSSTNNIGKRAYEMAAKLRAGKTNPVIPAPRQVFAS